MGQMPQMLHAPANHNTRALQPKKLRYQSYASAVVLLEDPHRAVDRVVYLRRHLNQTYKEGIYGTIQAV